MPRPVGIRLSTRSHRLLPCSLERALQRETRDRAGAITPRGLVHFADKGLNRLESPGAEVLKECLSSGVGDRSRYDRTAPSQCNLTQHDFHELSRAPGP